MDGSPSFREVHANRGGRQEIAKRPLTCWRATHIWRLQQAETALTGFVAVSRLFLVGTTDPGTIEPGEDTRRLFDIVGLDEGTCGRRPGLR
jgi:hypothetical protein